MLVKFTENKKDEYIKGEKVYRIYFYIDRKETDKFPTLTYSAFTATEMPTKKYIVGYLGSLVYLPDDPIEGRLGYGLRPNAIVDTTYAGRTLAEAKKNIIEMLNKDQYID